MTPPSPINPAASVSVAQSTALLVAQDAASAVGDRARRRIARRLVPFLFILYVFNYIDRVNVSYAALQMTNELQFSSTVFGAGAGIFFIGYFLLQLPATMLVEL